MSLKMKYPHHWIRVKSFSKDEWYTVDTALHTCTCPSFKNRKDTKVCKHMAYLGLFNENPDYPLKVSPTFSQAQSALVKSIRLRRPEDAVYWLVYLTGPTFSEPNQRFRVGRRILQGSAEDGMSIAVMEKVAEKFGVLCNVTTPLLYLVAEVLRICKVPNWWQTGTGGKQYLYDALVGWRKLAYLNWAGTLAELMTELEKCVVAKDTLGTMQWSAAFGQCKDEKLGATGQAEFAHVLALKYGNEAAQRLAALHLKLRGPLSGDGNFIGQAFWNLAGGKFAVQDEIHPVIGQQCKDLIDAAQERWKTPKPIAAYYCDGLHCGGGDPRFAGTMTQMYACCLAFEKYGRLDPADPWLREFFPTDGMVVSQA